jgi:hypothetical protein
MKDRSLLVDRQRYHPLATQLAIQLEDDGRLSLTASGYNNALTLDSLVARDQTHFYSCTCENQRMRSQDDYFIGEHLRRKAVSL